MLRKYTSGCHTFYCPDNFTGRMAWRRLDQKVSMIFIQTNFDKSDPVITFAYALAYLHERFLYRLCKYRPTVFCWAHKVVKKIAHIVRSMHIDTFRHPESAPRPCFFSILVSFHGRGQVAASRGECIPKSFKADGMIWMAEDDPAGYAVKDVNRIFAIHDRCDL